MASLQPPLRAFLLLGTAGEGSPWWCGPSQRGEGLPRPPTSSSVHVHPSSQMGTLCKGASLMSVTHSSSSRNCKQREMAAGCQLSQILRLSRKSSERRHFFGKFNAPSA